MTDCLDFNSDFDLDVSVGISLAVELVVYPRGSGTVVSKRGRLTAVWGTSFVRFSSLSLCFVITVFHVQYEYNLHASF